jgi:hypothetical protein
VGSEIFEFKLVTPDKIKKIIKSLKPTKALGADGIPVQVIQSAVNVLSEPLALLVNKSFITKKYLAQFKCALICPIHKGKGRLPVGKRKRVDRSV